MKFKIGLAAITLMLVVSTTGVGSPLAAEGPGDSRLAGQATVLIQDVRAVTGRPLTAVQLGLRLASGDKPSVVSTNEQAELRQPGALFVSTNLEAVEKAQ